MTTLPVIRVEAGLNPDTPVQPSTSLKLSDSVNGILGTNTLGNSVGWADISADVKSFTVTRPANRQGQGPLWAWQAGTVSILLDNSDRPYDPDNSAGPYAGKLSAMVPVRVRADFSSTAYGIYSGFADGWFPAEVTNAGDYSELTLSATDAFKVLAGRNLATVPIEGTGADTGARIRDILTRASWYTTAEKNVIDTGNSLLQGTTLGSDALSLMQLATDSEVGQLYVNGSGAVVFRARHALMTNARSNTVQAVFGDFPGAVHPAGTELAVSKITRSSDDTTIVNDVQAQRSGGSSVQEVTNAASITKYMFPRTYSRTDLILQNDSDVLNWANWVLYVGQTGEDRFETIQVNPLADPFNLWPQVLGREIGDRIQVWHRPPGLIFGTAWSLTNNYGSAPANQFTVPTTSVSQLTPGDTFQIYSSGVLKEPTTFRITSIGTDFFGNTAVTFTPSAQSVLAVGDVVTQTGGAVSRDCFIAGITHEWNSADSTWLTTWTLQDATKYGNFLTLGNPTLGKLGSNALTY